MTPKVKYWIFLLAIALIVFGVVIGSFVASWYNLSAVERETVGGLAAKLFPFPFIGGLVLLMIIGTLVSLLFHYYIIPILQIGEETKLISVANPDYRIAPRGSKEIIQLVHILNESGREFKRLRSQINDQVRSAQAQLTTERNRLAALMSEIPSGVLVCNREGQILLYNRQATKLLQQPGRLIGLGRSVFGVVDREPIVQALAFLQRSIREGKSAPTIQFMVRPQAGRSLRCDLAPVFSESPAERTLAGFVLIAEDLTAQIEADLQRDLRFQRLTETMLASAERIRRAVSTLRARSDLPVSAVEAQCLAIDRAAQAMEQEGRAARADFGSFQPARARAENVLGAYLLELLRKNLVRHRGLPAATRPAPDLWLKVDSLALVGGLTQFGDCLTEEGGGSVCLEISLLSDGQARLQITWPGCILDRDRLREWRDRPLGRGADGRLISFLQLIEKHLGTLTITGESLHLDLPLVRRIGQLEVPARAGERPIYYEFDLFNQPGGEELGKVPLSKLTFVVFDTETTGIHPSDGDEIIQIGAVRIVNGRILYNETLDQLIDPRRSVPPASVEIHGIAPELLSGQPTIREFLPLFHLFAEGAVLVAHNAAFDMKFLQLKEGDCGVRFDHPVLDTLLLSSAVHPHQEYHSLEEIARRLHIPIVGRHTALGDALVTAEVLVKLLPLLAAHGIHTLEDAIQASAASPFAKLSF